MKIEQPTDLDAIRFIISTPHLDANGDALWRPLDMDVVLQRAKLIEQRAEAAEAEVARLTDELAATLRALIGCDGDEGRDTSEYVTRWEAIMGDKWQGDE